MIQSSSIRHSNRSVVNPLKYLLRSFARTVRIAEGDAVGAEAGGEGRAFAFGHVFEVQVATLAAASTMTQVMRASLAVGYRLATASRVKWLLLMREPRPCSTHKKQYGSQHSIPAPGTNLIVRLRMIIRDSTGFMVAREQDHGEDG